MGFRMFRMRIVPRLIYNLCQEIDPASVGSREGERTPQSGRGDVNSVFIKLDQQNNCVRREAITKTGLGHCSH